MRQRIKMAGVPSLCHERDWSLVQIGEGNLTQEDGPLNYSNGRDGEACP